MLLVPGSNNIENISCFWYQARKRRTRNVFVATRLETHTENNVLLYQAKKHRKRFGFVGTVFKTHIFVVGGRFAPVSFMYFVRSLVLLFRSVFRSLSLSVLFSAFRSVVSQSFLSCFFIAVVRSTFLHVFVHYVSLSFLVSCLPIFRPFWVFVRFPRRLTRRLPTL